MPKTSKARAAPVRLAPTANYRPSASWSPEDDQTLMTAHAQGMTWKPLSQKYFPEKSPNACRKRHERLMERRNAQSWDGIKLERLATEYMRSRKEIWSPLADAVGEKWQFVEAKVSRACMEKGLINLTSAARGANRRSSGVSGMDDYLAKDDDSGIAMEDETEAEMDAGRRRQSRRYEGSIGGSLVAAASASSAAPMLQEPPSYYQYHSPPQPLHPPPQLLNSPPHSSPPPTSSVSTRAVSYGPTIASLLSPASAYS